MEDISKVLSHDETFNGKGLCLDISNLNDSISKTFLYYITPVFNFFSRNKQNIHIINSILKDYIPEWEKILHILDNRICLLHFITRMKDNEIIYKIDDSFKFDLYNQGIALVHFKKMDEDIYLISVDGGISIREDNLCLLAEIQETITFWNYGLVSVLWKNFGYGYSCKNGLGLLNNAYLQEVLALFKKKYSIFSSDFFEEACNKKTVADAIDMFYLFSRHEIDSKCNSLRIQFAQLAYMNSPFVDDSRKKDITILFDILWKITCNCEIARIYIEENEYKSRKNLCQIGKADRTTRIHIIFSLANNDIYSLRIDMPHKGVEYAHINLQELKDGHVADSPMPILDNELENEVKMILEKDLTKYFYTSGDDVLWFRVDFLNKIDELCDEEKKQRLIDIFKCQKHFEIKIENDGYDLFNEFKYYLKLYLSNFIQAINPIEIGEEIIKYRCVLWSRNMLETLRLGLDSEEQLNKAIDKCMKPIKKQLCSVTKEFTLDDLNIFAWSDILELLLNDIWCIN